MSYCEKNHKNNVNIIKEVYKKMDNYYCFW